jgi:predicted dehydrogenase
VAAFDLTPSLVERARQLGAEAGTSGTTEEQVAAALAWTARLGVDGVVVTATSSSEAPMAAAAEMCRDRARVVAVGAVPFGLPRQVAYEKELDLRISRSYGPGRYDPEFEEKGADYPIGYVRWTETRNLEAFLQLLADDSVRLDPLITHRVSLDEAPGAYETLVSGEGERPLGMVIGYPEDRSEARPRPAVARSAPAKPVSGEIGVGFVGAGMFAKSVLLPQFRNSKHVALKRVVTSRGLTARDVQRRFGFRESGTDFDAVFADPGIALVCVATRHDLHASLIVKALRADKHVFVEKPLALNEGQLRTVEDAMGGSSRILMVGFNRRFSPLAVRVRQAVAERGPLLMTYRVNAGELPPGHWANDPAVGGGRLIGEGCHFVDLCSYLAGDAEIVDVRARAAGRSRGLPQEFTVELSFADDSIAQILYTAQGAGRLGKERVEVHAGGVSAVIDDYGSGVIYRGGKSSKLTCGGKGHAEEIEALIASVRSGGSAPIPTSVLFGVTRATFEAHRQMTGDS